ncbi:MAG: protein kinase [Chloroflexi bacterium]|nr:protein kinase [Chloroflexota bacterium]MBI3341482.1 protein kinase [Chloroflexota bacterium]
MSFNIGENVGPYRIVEQLGQGGMATVYKAYHAALDRYVAVKALHPAFGEDPNFEARFQREARLVAKLEHPQIVPVYDYAEHEHRPYLVMKFIEGDTLKARLNQGPLTSDEINKVVDSVGSALAYAHKQGILHRDIKPSNVLLATDGQIYLADFGLARIAQAAESTLSSDMIMGTPQYISPEQAMGKKDLDEGTDIYSFGVMLYEMVVGQVPFNADTPFSIIHDHIYSPLPMPRAINPKVPEAVERVLLKGLAKERADRYANVGSFVEAFKDAWRQAGVPMEGTAITMRPTGREAAAQAKVAAKGGETAATISPRKKKRSPWPFIAAGILLFVCLGFVIFALRGARLLAAGKPTAVFTSTPAPTMSDHGPMMETLTAVAPPAATLPAAVATAIEHLNKNPDDPGITLQLSLAYWDAGQAQPSFESLAKAAELAGPNNTDFFQTAGDEFKKRQAWIGAAAMYLRVIKSLGPAGKPTDDMVENFHEALYKASTLPDLPGYLPFESIGRVEQPVTMVAQARNLYYAGKTDEAHSLLNQVKRLKPGMAEASLLEAEMDAKEGKTFDAKQTLNILLANLNTPDWVSEMAQTLLNKIP